MAIDAWMTRRPVLRSPVSVSPSEAGHFNRNRSAGQGQDRGSQQSPPMPVLPRHRRERRILGFSMFPGRGLDRSLAPLYSSRSYPQAGGRPGECRISNTEHRMSKQGGRAGRRCHASEPGTPQRRGRRAREIQGGAGGRKAPQISSGSAIRSQARANQTREETARPGEASPGACPPQPKRPGRWERPGTRLCRT